MQAQYSLRCYTTQLLLKWVRVGSVPFGVTGGLRGGQEGSGTPC